MRILLDTSFVYALAATPWALPERVRALLDEPDIELFVSAASIWEMRIKWARRHASGERKSPHDPEAVLTLLQDQPVTILNVTGGHAATARTRPRKETHQTH